MEGLRQEVESLGETLFGEVAKAASEAWHKCFAGKTEITRKALSPLRTIHQKLSGLSFVEPRVTPIVDLIHTAFEHLPRRGRIEGANLLMLQGLVSMLRDPDSLVDHGQKIIDGASSVDVLGLFVTSTVDAQIVDGLDMEDNDDMDNEEMPTFPQTVPTQPILPSCGLW